MKPEKVVNDTLENVNTIENSNDVKGIENQECKHVQLEDRISELERILENTEKNFKMLSDKFLEKEARFKDLEEKLNEFVNSLKTNDVVS